jgi:hypothetical protein
MPNRRKRIWINKFQTHLFYRIALYMVLYQVAVWSLFVIGQYIFSRLEMGMGESGRVTGFLLSTLILVFLGALFIYDAIQFAHRIVGPIHRFRKTIQAATEGDEVALVRLRKGDYLTEMQDDLNELLTVLEEKGAIVLKLEAAKAKDQTAVNV